MKTCRNRARQSISPSRQPTASFTGPFTPSPVSGMLKDYGEAESGDESLHEWCNSPNNRAGAGSSDQKNLRKDLKARRFWRLN